jgi:antitoxin HigA-1
MAPSPQPVERAERAPPPRPRRPPHLSWPVRRPPHPGEFLHTRYLAPLGISQTDLAATLGISRRRVNEMINGRRGITPDTALRLAAYFGNDAAFWMQLQVAWDMHAAVQQSLVRGTDTRAATAQRPAPA